MKCKLSRRVLALVLITSLRSIRQKGTISLQALNILLRVHINRVLQSRTKFSLHPEIPNVFIGQSRSYLLITLRHGMMSKPRR